MEKAFYIFMALALAVIASRLNWDEIRKSASESIQEAKESAADATGSSPSGSDPGPDAFDPREVKVYVTMGGQQYHARDCQLIRRGSLSTNLAAAKAKGFGACPYCGAAKLGTGSVRGRQGQNIKRAAREYRDNVLRKQGRLPGAANDPGPMPAGPAPDMDPAMTGPDPTVPGAPAPAPGP